MKKSILGVKISGNSEDELLKRISLRLKKNLRTIIYTPNPEILVEANRDLSFKGILNSSDINLADGIGLVFASGFKIKRIAGRLFFIKLLELADRQRLKVFLLGASEDVNMKAVLKIKKDYPNIKVEGASVPLLDREASLVSKKNINIYNDIIKHINDHSPDILFVALGAPKQEKWIYKNKSLKSKVFMSIGGSLNYFVGESVVPPNFISRSGLEWIWRGLFEPWRLKRIFTATVIFPLLVVKDKLTKIL